MKLLFRLLLILALAVALGIFARSNNGYVQIAAPMFRFESSLNFFVIAWVVSLALFYYLMRLVCGVRQLPEWWRMRRVQKVREKMFKLQNELFFALQRERFDDAQHKARELLSLPEAYPLPAVIGAKAALKMKDTASAESFIHCDALAPAVYRVTRTLLEAELLLVKNEPERALALLREMREWEGLHSAALKFELKALVNAHQYREILPLVDQMENVRGLSANEANFMRAVVQAYLDNEKAKREEAEAEALSRIENNAAKVEEEPSIETEEVSPERSDPQHTDDNTLPEDEQNKTS